MLSFFEGKLSQEVNEFENIYANPSLLFRFSQLAALRHKLNMSRQRLIISSLVIERLKAIKDVTLGQLLGVREDDTLSVLGFSVKITTKQQEDGSKVLDTLNYNIIPHLPGNLNPVAGFVVSSDNNGKELEDRVFETDSNLTPLLLTLNLDTQEITAKIKKNGTYEKVDYEIPMETYWDKFIHFRVISKLDVSYQFNANSIEKALTSAKKKINQDLAIQLKGSNVYIFANSVDGKGITDKTTVEDLQSLADSKMHFQDKRVLVCGLLLKNDTSELEAAPVITHVRESVKWAKNYVSIDALSIVNVKTKVSKLHSIILDSVRRNIILNESLLLKDIEEPIMNEKTVPRIYHFLPSSINHFITVAYKINSPDENKPLREMLHKKLLLPMNRPFFRSANEHWWVDTVSNSKENKILTNPHVGLNPSGVVGGTVFVVQGRYNYHHYMQDDIDDNGWGCAYRSLQTIVSWYRHQGLYNKPIPTHKQIQQALVAHGDKPSSFVGSTQWIGSIEVSFVLESLLNVSSRIMQVNSGDEMAMKGGQLSHHFKTQGTPVMIGGGVLAHTILGVDYNRKTGDIKFLVLDPHYTGEEDLSVIQGKGWCGWKGIDFWKKGHFYNMCLPQKPDKLNY